MSTVLHRITKQYKTSVNTPDFPVAEWIINPKMPEGWGSETRYLKIVGDVVSLQSRAERDATDDALKTERINEQVAQLDVDDDHAVVIETLVDQINILRANAGLGTFDLRVEYRKKLESR